MTSSSVGSYCASGDADARRAREGGDGDVADGEMDQKIQRMAVR